MPYSEDLKLEIACLQQQLTKKDKIIVSLRERVKRSIQKSGDAYAIFERNIVLQELVEQKTKILQGAIEEAQASNKAKSEFLANMSHELRTPLHAILSFSNFGEKDLAKRKDDDLGMYFKNIRTSGTNLLNLLNDLLDLSKLEAGKMTFDIAKTDIKKVIDNVVTEQQSLLDENNLTLKIIIDDNCMTDLLIDKGKIAQVIRNIFSNAIKFTSPGKTICIHLFPVTLTYESEENTSEDVPALHLMFKDQGIGIPEDEFKTVFDEFIQSSKTRTEAGGTGLGLAISREIIHGHQGKIWAESNPEGGSIFNIVLPLKQINKTELIEEFEQQVVV